MRCAISSVRASLPSRVTSQINKRTVHQAMEIMGIRESLRAGIPLCTQATRTDTFLAFFAEKDEGGLTAALQKRDSPFNDYRTTESN